MGLLDRIGAFERYKVSPTQGTSGLMTGAGRPMSPFAQQAARNIGGALGMDMRTPEEKILAAQKNIDTSTTSGLMQSIEARLQFETDPNKRNSLNMQLNQLRRQQAADARQAAADQRANQERERKAQSKLSTIAELEKFGLADDAERLKNDIWTTAQAGQILGSEVRLQRSNLETLEDQREYLETMKLSKDPLFSGLLSKDTKEPLSRELFNALAKKASDTKILNQAISQVEKLPENDNKQIAIDLLRAGAISSDRAVSLATDQVDTKNYSTNDFVDAETGLSVVTVLREGILHSWSDAEQEWVDGDARPLKSAPPEIKKSSKITPSDRKYAGDFAKKYTLSETVYGNLDTLEKTQFQNLVVSYMRNMSESSGRAPETHAQEAIDKVLKEHFTSEPGMLFGSNLKFNPAPVSTTVDEAKPETPAPSVEAAEEEEGDWATMEQPGQQKE
jgi:hypothetical protein